MDKIQFSKNKQNLVKKRQFLIVARAFVIFTFVIMLDILGLLHLHSVNYIPIQ